MEVQPPYINPLEIYMFHFSTFLL